MAWQLHRFPAKTLARGADLCSHCTASGRLWFTAQDIAMPAATKKTQCIFILSCCSSHTAAQSTSTTEHVMLTTMHTQRQLPAHWLCPTKHQNSHVQIKKLVKQKPFTTRQSAACTASRLRRATSRCASTSRKRRSLMSDTATPASMDACRTSSTTLYVGQCNSQSNNRHSWRAPPGRAAHSCLTLPRLPRWMPAGQSK